MRGILEQMLVERVAVQFVFPTRDDQGGYAVTDHVDNRPAHAEETVHAENNGMPATGIVGITIMVATNAMNAAP